MQLGEATLSEVTSCFRTEKDIVVILHNMLKALNFVHSANLIHRDIKA